jgi:hypothetical protein
MGKVLQATGMKCEICTRKLIPRRIVVLEKLKVPQLVKNLSLPCLWNPKVHYRVRKNPSLVPNLSQIRDILESKDCVLIIERV